MPVRLAKRRQHDPSSRTACSTAVTISALYTDRYSGKETPTLVHCGLDVSHAGNCEVDNLRCAVCKQVLAISCGRTAGWSRFRSVRRN